MVVDRWWKSVWNHLWNSFFICFETCAFRLRTEQDRVLLLIALNLFGVREPVLWNHIGWSVACFTRVKKGAPKRSKRFLWKRAGKDWSLRRFGAMNAYFSSGLKDLSKRQRSSFVLSILEQTLINRHIRIVHQAFPVAPRKLLRTGLDRPDDQEGNLYSIVLYIILTIGTGTFLWKS